MLRSLHVRNYVLIDSLEIDFPEGLVIITGQTGAGKSILLGALGLVLGGKADASLVGAHGDTCVVEAEFSVGEDATLKALLRENDLEESGSLVIRRTLNRTGRSRSFVNDEPVALPVLQALAERLIDIHAQHQTLRLADPAFRMSLLDHYAGNAGRLEVCKTTWNALQGIRKELAEVTDRIQRLSAEKEWNEALFARLEAYIEIPKLELNTADSAALVALRGIGPYYARKILDYRERLGGFVDAAQLLEIEGIDADRLAGFFEDVTVDAKKIRKIDLWHASDTVLARHPYIGAKGARSVLRYRQLYDSARWTLPDLAKERALPPENIEKLKKYIEIQ